MVSAVRKHLICVFHCFALGDFEQLSSVNTGKWNEEAEESGSWGRLLIQMLLYLIFCVTDLQFFPLYTAALPSSVQIFSKDLMFYLCSKYSFGCPYMKMKCKRNKMLSCRELSIMKNVLWTQLSILTKLFLQRLQ